MVIFWGSGGRTNCRVELWCLHAFERIACWGVVGADGVEGHFGSAEDDPECSCSC